MKRSFSLLQKLLIPWAFAQTMFSYQGRCVFRFPLHAFAVFLAVLATTTPTARAQGADVANGGSMYTSRCSGCHGSEPTGNKLKGASLSLLQSFAAGSPVAHPAGTGAFGGANLVDLAAFISSKDPNTYTASGRI